MAALTPSTDPTLLPAYRFGQVMALLVAALFASVHGVVVAGIGLVLALVVFRIFFTIMRGIVFPLIQELARIMARGR